MVAEQIDLTDARVQIDRAKYHYKELVRHFTEWNASGGIRLETVRDPIFAHYSWNVVVHALPAQNMPGLAGDVVNDLWKALDYTAFAIYRAGGGVADGGRSGDVAFPILKTEPDDWNSVVSRKVPGIWPDAAEALRASQPFAQGGDEAIALPILQGLGRTDKHRNLNLCAAAAFSANAIFPHGPADVPVSVNIFLNRIDDEMAKGPLVPIEPGTVVPVAAAYVQPDPAPFDDAVIVWKSGIRFDEPPPPDVEFGFRANNGSEATIAALGWIRQHVEQIVERVGQLPQQV